MTYAPPRDRALRTQGHQGCLTEGPQAWRSFWMQAIDSIAAPFEKGLGPREDWTVEGCKRRAPENVKALIQGHDMQVRRK